MCMLKSLSLLTSIVKCHSKFNLLNRSIQSPHNTIRSSSSIINRCLEVLSRNYKAKTSNQKYDSHTLQNHQINTPLIFIYLFISNLFFYFKHISLKVTSFWYDLLHFLSG